MVLTDRLEADELGEQVGCERGDPPRNRGVETVHWEQLPEPGK